MSEQITQTYYRIRFPEKSGTGSEFYSSRNGTDRWYALAKIKALISQGQRKGYKGQIRVPFEGYEVVEVTEKITHSEKIIKLTVK